MKQILLLIAVITASLFAVSVDSSTALPLLDHESLSLLFIGGYVVNQGTLVSLGRNFQAIFTKYFDGVEVKILVTVMPVTSKAKIEDYAWLNPMGELREWLGDRVIEELSMGAYTITNKKFEKTIGVDRGDIEDDNVGLYEPRIQMIADAAKRHPGVLVINLIVDGETNLCYDGKPFFSATHPNGDQADFSNLLIGSALSAATYETGRQTTMAYVNSEGASLGIVPTHLIVPPQLEKRALEIIKAGTVIGDDTAGGSKENVWKGTAEVIVEPRLGAKPTEWYLAALDRPIKPFIHQMRRAAEFTSMEDPKDQNVFMKDEYLYGVSYRGNAGYGLPHLMLKGKA